MKKGQKRGLTNVNVASKTRRRSKPRENAGKRMVQEEAMKRKARSS